MTVLSRIRLFGLMFGLMALVACDTAEERAEGHYQRGLQLLEEGKTEQALLEFKNALQLNEDSVAPRMEFAKIRMEQGEFRGAIGNFLKVIEVEENNLEARIHTGRLILQFENEPEEAREHIEAAAAIAPDNIEVRALLAAMDQNQGRAEDAANKALAVLADDPGNVMAVSVLVAQRIDEDDYDGVIAVVDKAIAASPDELTLHVTKLRALEELDDQGGIGTQLAEMSERFPDNPQVAQGRVQWYLNNQDAFGAIEAQRRLARLFTEEPSYALGVVSLLERFEGPETARAELMALVESEAHIVPFNRALADFEFRQNNSDVAEARLNDLLAMDLSRTDKHDTLAQLANILRATGDDVRSREIVEGVIAEASDHVEALKTRALSFLDEDKPHSAITDLRAALSVRAQDPEILMMLALAHERNGSATLAQERMALAVQVSDSGISESLRYAEFLMRQEKTEIALDVLTSALNAHGDVPALLIGMGQVQLSVSDWSGARETAAKLGQVPDNPQALQAAQELQVAVLNGEQRFEQSIGVLRQMWDLAGQQSSAMENLVAGYMRAGKTGEAADFLDNVLRDDPANLRANLLRGALHAFVGEAADAEARYSKVIEDHPTAENGYGALASLLSLQGREAEADEVIQTGIETARNTDRLLFSKASRLEEKQDYEGAIAIYERLYAANRISDVLANNLASLLSEFRDTPEDLERAHNIAKRLRTSREPAFQDTYGWILYKRGEYERALTPLETAAEGAPYNVFVQYHLGMAYAKLGQKDRAITQLTRALELGEGSGLPVLQTAQETLTQLQEG